MKRSGSSLILPALLGGLGLVVGAWLGVTLGPEVTGSSSESREPATPSATEGGLRPPSTPVGRPTAGSSAEAEIWATLEEEWEARVRLEEEVAALRAEVAALGRSGPGSAAKEAVRPSGGEARSEQPWFNAQGLLDAGVDPAEVRELQERFEEIELGRLYLRDRAAREGWAGSARYREESRALDARFEGFREELGPEGYDRLLFAIGRPNRARVQDLLERAPAREAGIKPGDIIVSYDGHRIFTIPELRRATTEGQAGARVELKVERDGETIRLYVPRGPLGARLVPARRAPLE